MKEDKMTEKQWNDVKTVSEIFQAVPENQRERVRDILSGYRMGLTDGFRLCGVPPDTVPRPTA